MIKVLINAYACSPSEGSEPGMAWNWIFNIAKYCKVNVITEGQWKNEIESSIRSNYLTERIKFHYIPVADNVRKMCWNQGDWRFYYYYNKWQLKVQKVAINIVKNEKIDIIHQLNMVGYREPGVLWQIENIPKIWGPIGGFGGIPISYLLNYKKPAAFKQIVKQVINKGQIYLPYIRNAVNNFDYLIACNSDAKIALEKIKKKEVLIIPEVGSCRYKGAASFRNFKEPQLKVAWVGRNIESKALNIALEVFKKLKGYNIGLNIYGVESKDVKEFQVGGNITFHGWKDHGDVIEELKSCHVLLFTSLFESTGTAVLEALSLGIPVLCHNVCGMAYVITDHCGIKVEMNGPLYSIDSFKHSLITLFNNRKLLQEMSNGAVARASELSWENNCKKMLEVYNAAVRSLRYS